MLGVHLKLIYRMVFQRSAGDKENNRLEDLEDDEAVVRLILRVRRQCTSGGKETLEEWLCGLCVEKIQQSDNIDVFLRKPLFLLFDL